MLKIDEIIEEGWDEESNEFVPEIKVSLTLEHSLLSISKWESKWHKPFLIEEEKTDEEFLDYIKCMCITQNVSDETIRQLPLKIVKRIQEYIADDASATTFYDRRTTRKGSRKKETITSELIYYWMVAYQIPFSCEKWHLKRLMNLIKICEIKNEDPKNSTMSREEVLAMYKKTNQERRKKLNTKG